MTNVEYTRALAIKTMEAVSYISGQVQGMHIVLRDHGDTEMSALLAEAAACLDKARRIALERVLGDAERVTREDIGR